MLCRVSSSNWQGNWGSERLSDLPKVTQLVSAGASLSDSCHVNKTLGNVKISEKQWVWPSLKPKAPTQSCILTKSNSVALNQLCQARVEKRISSYYLHPQSKENRYSGFGDRRSHIQKASLWSWTHSESPVLIRGAIIPQLSPASSTRAVRANKTEE